MCNLIIQKKSDVVCCVRACVCVCVFLRAGLVVAIVALLMDVPSQFAALVAFALLMVVASTSSAPLMVVKRKLSRDMMVPRFGGKHYSLLVECPHRYDINLG